MNKVLKLIMLLLSIQVVQSQTTKIDSLIMSKSIEDFRNVKNSNCQILTTTYNSERYGYNNGIAIKCLKKSKTKLPKNIITDFEKKIEILTEKKIPNFTTINLVERFSENYQRLSSNFEVSSETSDEQIKNIEDKIKNKLQQLQENNSADNLNILEISEPLYDKTNKNLIILVSYFKPGIQEFHIMIYSKKLKLWNLTEKILMSKERF